MEIKFQFTQKPTSARLPESTALTFNNATQITIGRDAKCDIALECPEQVISRHHTTISRADSGYIATDVSANGTYINNAADPIGNGNSVKIKHGDSLRIGGYVMQLTLSNSQVQETRTVVRNINEVSKSHSQTPARQAKPAVSSVQQSFGASQSQIPQNWNVSFKEKQVQSNVVPDPLKKPLDFSKQEKVLTEQLLKGLGVSGDSSDIDLSPEEMLILGQCLRASLVGLFKHRDHAEKLKAKLCFNDREMLKEAQNFTLSQYSSADDFIQNLIKGSPKPYHPLEIVKSHKEVLEDQVAVYKSFNSAIDSFRDDLSPESIENEFKTQDKAIYNKLVPSVGKWNLYKAQWSQRCLSFKQTIKDHFRANISNLYHKRLLERKRPKGKKI